MKIRIHSTGGKVAFKIPGAYVCYLETVRSVKPYKFSFTITKDDTDLMIKHKLNEAIREFVGNLMKTCPRVKQFHIEPKIFLRIARQLDKIS